MSWIRDIFAGRDSRAHSWVRDGGDPFAPTRVAPKNVSEKSALMFGVVFDCVNMISTDISTLPVKVYRESDPGMQALTTPEWVRTPNVEQTWRDFAQQFLASACLWGNTYTLVTKNSQGRPLELWVLDPATVTVDRNEMSNDLEYRVEGELVPPGMLLHSKAWTLPGDYVGLSPIGLRRESILAGLATDEFASSLWENGAQLTGILNLPAGTNPDEVAAAASSFRGRHTGSKNVGGVAVVGGGGKYQQMTVNPVDAQFLETRVHTRRDIAAMYRVPLHKLADLERSTFSNIEHQGIEYVTDCLRPWIVRLEEAVTRLLPRGQAVQLDDKALLRGDAKTEAEALKIARDAGAITLNDWRAELGMAPVSDEYADAHFGPMNFARLDGDFAGLAQRYDTALKMVQYGFDPEEAFESLGLEPVEHTGHLPVTVQAGMDDGEVIGTSSDYSGDSEDGVVPPGPEDEDEDDVPEDEDDETAEPVDEEGSMP